MKSIFALLFFACAFAKAQQEGELATPRVSCRLLPADVNKGRGSTLNLELEPGQIEVEEFVLRAKLSRVGPADDGRWSGHSMHIEIFHPQSQASSSVSMGVSRDIPRGGIKTFQTSLQVDGKHATVACIVYGPETT